MLWYYFTIGTTLVFFSFLALVYFGVFMKNSKLESFLKSTSLKLVTRKILFAIFTLFIIITAIFFLTELLPNKYSYSSTSNQNSYSNNLFYKYINYLYNILPIPKKVCSKTYLYNNDITCASYKYTLVDLGMSNSYMKNVSVISIIKDKCSISFYLGISTYLLQCIIGYPLGIYLAKRDSKLEDKLFNAVHITTKIIPPVVYFYLFVLLFMVVFKLPVIFEESDALTYIAPLTTITFSSSLYLAYFVKKYISLEIDKDYVKFAISKGLGKNTILYKHVIRNALIPFIRTIPSSILLCFSGYYLLEASFNIPGVGLTLIHAIRLNDIYLIRGLIIFFTSLSIVSYLIGDLLTIVFRKKDEYVKEDKRHE